MKKITSLLIISILLVSISASSVFAATDYDQNTLVGTKIVKSTLTTGYSSTDYWKKYAKVYTRVTNGSYFFIVDSIKNSFTFKNEFGSIYKYSAEQVGDQTYNGATFRKDVSRVYNWKVWATGNAKLGSYSANANTYIDDGTNF